MESKAVISLARRQIRKYANRWCEVFFCSRLFFCVSVLSDFGFVEQYSRKHYKLTTNFICVFGNFYLRANRPLRVEDLFARK